MLETLAVSAFEPVGLHLSRDSAVRTDVGIAPKPPSHVGPDVADSEAEKAELAELANVNELVAQ